MTVATASGSGTGRWSLLRRLAFLIGPGKRSVKAEPKGDAYNDYWKVRSHRGPATTDTVSK